MFFLYVYIYKLILLNMSIFFISSRYRKFDILIYIFHVDFYFENPEIYSTQISKLYNRKFCFKLNNV